MTDAQLVAALKSQRDTIVAGRRALDALEEQAKAAPAKKKAAKKAQNRFDTEERELNAIHFQYEESIKIAEADLRAGKPLALDPELKTSLKTLHELMVKGVVKTPVGVVDASKAPKHIQAQLISGKIMLDTATSLEQTMTGVGMTYKTAQGAWLAHEKLEKAKQEAQGKGGTTKGTKKGARKGGGPRADAGDTEPSFENLTTGVQMAGVTYNPDQEAGQTAGDLDAALADMRVALASGREGMREATPVVAQTPEAAALALRDTVARGRAESREGSAPPPVAGGRILS